MKKRFQVASSKGLYKSHFLLIGLAFVLLVNMALAQSPPCTFSASVSPTGLATVDLTAAPGSWCKNVIDWGDGCVNETTTDPVTHQYASCGTFTIAHTIYDANCVEAGTCNQGISVSAPAVFITLTRQAIASNTACGVRQRLRSTLSILSGCQSANQSVTISGTVPDEFIIVGGDYTVNGNDVTITVTSAQINSGSTIIDLEIMPKWCTPNATVQVNLSASTTGMAIASTSQPDICDAIANAERF